MGGSPMPRHPLPVARHHRTGLCRVLLAAGGKGAACSMTADEWPVGCLGYAVNLIRPVVTGTRHTILYSQVGLQQRLGAAWCRPGWAHAPPAGRMRSQHAAQSAAGLDSCWILEVLRSQHSHAKCFQDRS